MPRWWQLDAKASRSVGLVLLLVALAGKLAFLNLRASSRASGVMLLSEDRDGNSVYGKQGRLGQTLAQIQKAAHGDKLSATLAHLEKERSELSSKLAKVSEEQKHAQMLRAEKEEKKIEDARVEKAIAAAHKKEVNALKQKLDHEREEKQTMLKKVDDMAGIGTRTDEAMVQLVMSAAQKKQQERALDLRLEEAEKAHAEREAALKEEAREEADEALVKKGMRAKEGKVGAAPLHQLKVERKKLKAMAGAAESKQDAKLANENAKLEKEIASMKKREAARKAKAAAEEKILHGGSDTGLGRRLTKAGVVVDSWGPLTSTAGTMPDPRDTFAKMPHSMLPVKISPPTPAIAHATTEHDLEEDLGFKSSILYSKNFKKEW